MDKGEREGGTNWEIKIDIYTLPRIYHGYTLHIYTPYTTYIYLGSCSIEKGAQLRAL